MYSKQKHCWYKKHCGQIKQLECMATRTEDSARVRTYRGREQVHIIRLIRKSYILYQ